MDLTEKKLLSEQVYSGAFMQVQRDKVLLPDGTQSTREYIRHPGAVAVLALNEDSQLIMERQYRYPVGRVMLEIPAGKIDPDESPEACGQRELWEETGYSARDWTYLGTAFPCIGYADEEIHYFLAQGLSHAERQLDHGEFVEVRIMSLAEVMAMAASGEICDSKTLVGLFWLKAHLEGR